MKNLRMKKSENENLRIKKSENGKSETNYNLVDNDLIMNFYRLQQQITTNTLFIP